MTILIGFVPTPAGEAALEAGLAEAARSGEDVVILNTPRRGATVDRDLIGEDAAQELLTKAAAQGVTARIDQADHGSDIVATFESLVEGHGARMVVLGLRRRSPVGKLVLGSDAQRLLIELEVPILAVKPAR
jgi:nucleotide-binding universal stress UspA family protein